MSLVDDWEEKSIEPSFMPVEIQNDFNNSNSGYISLPKGILLKTEEKPMFSLEKVEYKPNGLKHMVICSGILVMALNNGHIIRLDLKNPEELEDIEITKKNEDQIYRLFMDPSGSHLLIAMENEETYYLNIKWKKPKLLSKMKGIIISAVGWDRQCDSLSTRDILIGTTKGRIYQANIEANEKSLIFDKLVVGVGGVNRGDQTFKLLYNVTDNMCITGLRFERFVTSSPSEPTKFFIMATTPTRIYQFIGGPTFENVFVNYEVNPGFHELPGEFNHSELQFFSKYANGLPKSFAWLTGPGIYYGNLIFGSQNPGDSVMTDTSLLSYPRNEDDTYEEPISLVLTEFHFIILYPNHIVAISTLTKEKIWEEYFMESQRLGKIRGLTHDSVSNTTFLYAEYAVYELEITDEDRNVWEMYLQKKQYESALQYCKNPLQKDKVWSAQADHYFNDNNFQLAATYYGKTQKSFEEVTLKFLNINDQNALKTYLLTKLENIKNSKNKDATQITMIGTWLTEIYLDKLNTSLSEDHRESLLDEFQQFLKDYKDHLDKATTFNLISSHGRIEELLYYATIIEDYEKVINHYIQQEEYDKALEVMSKQNKEENYYKFSPILMQHIPYKTVNTWIKASSLLNPKKLIPSLMKYDMKSNPPEDKDTNQAIRYLQYCVQKLDSKDPTIHNYLLSLYAKEKDEGPLLNFINQQEKYFDLKYALRLATKENKITACILIYSSMGLYEEAVELALKVDIELAKINADKPEEDEALKKKLWLKIARYVVEEEKNIKKAMELLNQCQLLKIEDILPFFPDFTRIDTFKEEICSSLEDYNRHIEELKTEMDEATKSADLIRMDIKDLRNKYGFVAANQFCYLCHHLVLTKDFYLFPCEHVFHADCLKDKMLEYLDNVQRSRVTEIIQKIQQFQNKDNFNTNQTKKRFNLLKSTILDNEKEQFHNEVIISNLDKLKDELDDIIASECIFCGELMIKTIAEPFIQPGEMERQGWAI